MKHFLKLLMMAMVMFIVDDEGGGGEGSGVTPTPDGGSGDGVPTASAQHEAGGDGDTVTVPKSFIEQVASMHNTVTAIETERMVNSAVTDIKARNPDFDVDKVKNHLIELKKTDPEKAAALNNPQGWELLWMRDISEKDVGGDDVNHGRKHTGDSRRDLIDRIRSGEADAGERASLLGKYL